MNPYAMVYWCPGLCRTREDHLPWQMDTRWGLGQVFRPYWKLKLDTMGQVGVSREGVLSRQNGCLDVKEGPEDFCVSRLFPPTSSQATHTLFT